MNQPVIRTYKHSGKYSNPGKMEQIKHLSIDYMSYYNSLMIATWKDFIRTGDLPKKFLPRLKISSLSERFKQTCGSQVKSCFDSDIGNTQRRFRRVVLHSKLSNESKKTLLYINKHGLWFKNEVELKGKTVEKPIISTSTGNQYGTTLYSKIKKYDRIIQNKIKGRMKDGLYKNSPEITRLYEKASSLVKNEIGRAVNKLIEKENPSIIHLEFLDNIARNTRTDRRLSKTMRRLLLRCGFSRISDRIKQRCEALGIEVREYNPAYSSQTCLSCGHIHRKSRNGLKFKCVRCGKKYNPDVLGSRNMELRGRSKLLASLSIWSKKIKSRIFWRRFI